jgi:hypothetical protein
MLAVKQNDLIGAVKIKDGLFLGDEYAAQDLEFIVTNKVAHIINAAGRQMPNHWESIGINYLTLNWIETDNQILFDAKDEIINELFRFIDNALLKGESVLVQSVKGQNRSCCVLAAFFIKKYRWTLYKTLEFLHSRKPTLEIRASFFNQLIALENKLTKNGQGPKTYNWTDVSDKNAESDELILTNTFLNSKAAQTDHSPVHHHRDAKTKVIFQLSSNIEYDIRYKPTNTNHSAKLRSQIKSILKGSGKVFFLRPQPPESPDVEKQNRDSASSMSRSNMSKVFSRPTSAKPHAINGALGKSSSSTVLDRSENSVVEKSRTLNITTSAANSANTTPTNQQPPPLIRPRTENIRIGKPTISLNNFMGNDFGSPVVTPDNSGMTSSLKMRTDNGPNNAEKMIFHKKSNSIQTKDEPVKEQKENSLKNSITIRTNDSSSKKDLDLESPLIKNFSKLKKINREIREIAANGKTNAANGAVNNNELSSTSGGSISVSFANQDKRAVKMKSTGQLLDKTSSYSMNMSGSFTSLNKPAESSGLLTNKLNNIYKFVSPGRSEPVRANADIFSMNGNSTPEYDSNFGSKAFNLSYDNSGGFGRPSTAPEKVKLKKTIMADSPYNAVLTFKGRSKASGSDAAQSSSSVSRQASLQPLRDLMFGMTDSSASGAKFRLRSSSPRNANKPRWKV